MICPECEKGTYLVFMRNDERSAYVCDHCHWIVTIEEYDKMVVKETSRKALEEYYRNTVMEALEQALEES